MSDITIEDIVEWNRLAKLLKKIKADEVALRKKIVNKFAQKDGKVDKEIGGFSLKGKKGVTTSIEDKEDLLEDRDGMEPQVQDCFPLDVKFSKTAYNKLDDIDKAEVDVYIVEKPSAPTLKLEVIK